MAVQGGFFGLSVCIVTIPFVANNLDTAYERYWTTFGILMIFGVCNTFAQGQAFGLASILPGKYIGIFSFGNGVSGIFVNLLKVILNITLPGNDNLYTQGLIFYAISCLVLLICAFSYSVLV